MKSIKSLGIAPEDYEIERMISIPNAVLEHSEMAPVERQFINGLIRLLKPRRILELGVAEGAGAVVILNAISDIADATLTSFDIEYKLWNAPEKDVGFAAVMMYPNGNKQWKLFKGADFSPHVDEFNEPFDMVVIDTAHLHPVESLNVIAVLPYLSDQAVIVIHDLALHTLQADRFNAFPNLCLANKLAYDTIVGEKLKPGGKRYLDHNHGFASLGAVQISGDTKKYIGNLFDMLNFPWPSYIYHVSPYIIYVAKIIKKHYSSELFERFCTATMVNAMFVIEGYKYRKYSQKTLEIYHLLRQAPRIVFYGGGFNCKRLLQLFERNGLNKPCEIWDIAADSKGSIDGIQILSPPFSDIEKRYDDAIIIITIADLDISREVKKNILLHSASAQIFEANEVYRSVVYAEVNKLAEICE